MMSSSTQTALQRFLDRLLRRSDLSDEAQSIVLNLGSTVIEAKVHQQIVWAGKRVHHACLVVDGLVGRLDVHADGSRQITSLSIPGDLCDLQSVMWPIPCWGFEALTASTVLRIPHEDLRRAAATHPELALAFWRDTIVDASILATWVSNRGSRSAKGRLSHLLCEMGTRLETTGICSRNQFYFPIVQKQLAEALGLTSVHTNRMLGSLRMEDAIRIHRNTIYVDDWGKLDEIAEFDPTYLMINRPAKLAV